MQYCIIFINQAACGRIVVLVFNPNSIYESDWFKADALAKFSCGILFLSNYLHIYIMAHCFVFLTFIILLSFILLSYYQIYYPPIQTMNNGIYDNNEKDRLLTIARDTEDAKLPSEFPYFRHFVIHETGQSLDISVYSVYSVYIYIYSVYSNYRFLISLSLSLSLSHFCLHIIQILSNCCTLRSEA